MPEISKEEFERVSRVIASLLRMVPKPASAGDDYDKLRVDYNVVIAALDLACSVEPANLIEALEPFAELNEALERHYADYPDSTALFACDGRAITHRDFRRAASAIASSRHSDGERSR